MGLIGPWSALPLIPAHLLLLPPKGAEATAICLISLLSVEHDLIGYSILCYAMLRCDIYAHPPHTSFRRFVAAPRPLRRKPQELPSRVSTPSCPGEKAASSPASHPWPWRKKLPKSQIWSKWGFKEITILMYVYMYLSIRIYIYVYIYIHMYISMCIYLSMVVWVGMQVCIYIYSIIGSVIMVLAKRLGTLSSRT